MWRGWCLFNLFLNFPVSPLVFGEARWAEGVHFIDKELKSNVSEVSHESVLSQLSASQEPGSTCLSVSSFPWLWEQGPFVHPTLQRRKQGPGRLPAWPQPRECPAGTPLATGLTAEPAGAGVSPEWFCSNCSHSQLPATRRSLWQVLEWIVSLGGHNRAPCVLCIPSSR